VSFMKNVLVTGSNGQLGLAIRKVSENTGPFNFTFVDINELDLTDLKKVKDFLSSTHFDYIINCAAYTAVDMAEKQPEKVFSINAKVPEMLAVECVKKKIRLIHLSTDYVYDGSNNVPHSEDDRPRPLSVYAKSKLAGEKALWKNPFCMVIRTSWLYSEYGNNFLRTMIRLSAEKKEISVVFDQAGTPTYAGDLAGVLIHLLSYSERHSFKAGIYNYSGEGVCSWYDFACEIMKLTGSTCRVIPVRTQEYPLPARRPAYSVMDKSKIKRTFDIRILHWKESLQIAIKNIESQRA